MTLIILVFVFLAVVALTWGVAILFSSRRGSPAEDRLDALAQSQSPGMQMAGAGSTSLLAVPLEQSEQRGALEQFVSRFAKLRALVEQAGVAQSPFQLVLLSIALVVGVGLVLAMTNLPFGVGPLAALLAGCLPLAWVLWKRHKRLEKFERQLPEAMELLARSLRAGHSVADGIRLIGEEMALPISSEFSRCFEQQNLGKPLNDALEEMADRIPNLDVRFFATSVILQRQTGGDMAEILEKIGYLIRQRLQIRGQIKALTGEGRLSAAMLLGMPIVLAVYMYIRDPEYLRPLVEHPLGQQMTIVAIILQIVGALVIKKLVSIKV